MAARGTRRHPGGVLPVAASAVLAVGRLRRWGSMLLLAVLVAIGDRLTDQAVPLDRPWAAPLALGGYLLWNAASAAPRIVRRRLPGGLAPIPDARAEEARDVLAAHHADLDAVVRANRELRKVPDARGAAGRIARIATDLLDADGAVVWLRGPGRLLCAGGYGTTPAPDREIASGSPIDDALSHGSVSADRSEIVVPLTGSGAVFGAVCVNAPRRELEPFLTSVLQILGTHAGHVLERLRAIESVIDARFVDPVTGVGNRHAATASLATMRPGDAVLLLALDDLERIRRHEGDAKADLVLGQLGLHLRNGTRAGDLVARFADDVFLLVLRELGEGAELVAGRLLESWLDAGAPGSLRGGAALHFADSTPLDALDRATEALDVARLDLRDGVHPDPRATPDPARVSAG